MIDIKLENIVNHRIAILSILMKRQVYKIISERKLEITPDQWVIMYYLWEENGLSIGEIAKRSKKDYANVTRIVEKLEKRKYVSKKKSKSDSRICNVFILSNADGIKAEIQNCWQQAADTALNGISKSDQKKLMQTLGKIENNIQESLEIGFE